MANRTNNPATEYEALSKDIKKLTELLSSAWSARFEGEEINWNHVGTAQFVRSELVNLIAAFDYENGDEEEARVAVLDRIK